MVSVASVRVSSHMKPAEGAASPNAGLSAKCTASSVHMPSGAAWNAARTLGGSITAATPPWTMSTSPLIVSATVWVPELGHRS